ncbi:MAG TPA: hypothetical protein VFO73_11980, partial [Candidatus Limnocylindrales bacterium]|nr:hypothetical protein [Candidatus Limnocylindrales bacterium]
MTPIHRRRLTPLRYASLLAAIVLAVAACGSSAPTPSPSSPPSATPNAPTPVPTAQDPTEIYAAIEEQVLAIRGLEAKSPVNPKVLDDAGIKKLTQDSFKEDNPPELIAANERMLKMMGLLAPDASLTDLYIDLLGSQVAGLYSPDDKQLYVVSKSGALGPAEKTTFAHEYTHALQDQNFDLSGFDLDQVGEGDRAIARLSLIEGDATLVMSYWQIGNLSQAELLELLGQGLDPEATRILEEMPTVLRESLLFPYTTGLTFAQRLQGIGGWEAVDAAFAKPPASTEQVIHPEKYDAAEAPIAVDLPNDLAARLGVGWSVALEDTLGEFQLSIWLSDAGGGTLAGATEAAAGWGGDRSAVLTGPDGATAVVIATEWDTAADATEFAT